MDETDKKIKRQNQELCIFSLHDDASFTVFDNWDETMFEVFIHTDSDFAMSMCAIIFM